MTVVIFLIIREKPITYDNAFPMIKWEFLPEDKLNFVKGTIVARDMTNLGMRRKEVIQVISDIGQDNSYHQEENHDAYLVW